MKMGEWGNTKWKGNDKNKVKIDKNLVKNIKIR